MSQKITGFISKEFIFPVAIKSGVRIHDNISVAILIKLLKHLLVLIVFIWPKIHFCFEVEIV
jgi:hypothetical protein